VGNGPSDFEEMFNLRSLDGTIDGGRGEFNVVPGWMAPVFVTVNDGLAAVDALAHYKLPAK